MAFNHLLSQMVKMSLLAKKECFMKKFLAVLLSLFVALGCFAMAGCKESSVFDGNYTETDKAGITAFATAVEEKETAVDFADGVKMTFEVSFPIEDKVYEIEMEFKTMLKNNKLLIEGEMEMPMQNGKGDVDTMTADFWFADDYMYMKAKYDGEEVKMKMLMNINEFIDEYAGASTDDVETDLSDLLEEYADVEGVKFYLEQTETISKAKLEVPETIISGQKVKMTSVLVYNEEQILTGVMMDLEMYLDHDSDPETEDIISRTYVSIEQWTGEIELPSDYLSYSPI